MNNPISAPGHPAEAKRAYVPPRHLMALQRCLAVSTVTPELLLYIRRHKLDQGVVEARCSFVSVVLATFYQHNSAPNFDFDPVGIPTVVIGWHPLGSETPHDLVAWPLGYPDRYATLLREAEILGTWDTRYGNRPLRLHKTPEDWLTASCQGCVILNPAVATYWLDQIHGPFLVADIAHGRQIAIWLRPLNRAHEIVIKQGLAA